MSKYTRKNTGNIPQIQPPIAIFYGGPDVGKTTFASKIPNSFFLMTEKGLGVNTGEHFQNDDGSPIIPVDFKDFWDQAQAMKTEEFSDVKYVIVDTLTALETLIHNKVADDAGKVSIEDIGYGAGYKQAVVFHQLIMNWAKELQSMGKGVIFLAHEQVTRFDSPTSQSYDTYQIKLHKAAFQLYHESTDIIGHCFIDSVIKTEEAGFNKEKKRAVSKGKRMVRLKTSPACTAKNRFSLPEKMQLDWSEIHAGMISSIKAFQEKVTEEKAA